MPSAKPSLRRQFEQELHRYLTVQVNRYVQQYGGLHKVVNDLMLIAEPEWEGTEVGIIHDRRVAFERSLYTKEFNVELVALELDEAFSPNWVLCLIFKEVRKKLPCYPVGAFIQFHAESFKVNDFLFKDGDGHRIRPKVNDAIWERLLTPLKVANTFGLLKGKR